MTNQAADELADEAAERSAHMPGDLNLVGKLDEITAIVGRRLLATTRFVVENRAAVVRQPKRPPTAPLHERLKKVGAAYGHDLVTNYAGIQCRRCQRAPRSLVLGPQSVLGARRRTGARP